MHRQADTRTSNDIPYRLGSRTVGCQQRVEHEAVSGDAHTDILHLGVHQKVANATDIVLNTKSLYFNASQMKKTNTEVKTEM